MKLAEKYIIAVTADIILAINAIAAAALLAFTVASFMLAAFLGLSFLIVICAISDDNERIHKGEQNEKD
jgi:hypothetical protein